MPGPTVEPPRMDRGRLLVCLLAVLSAAAAGDRAHADSPPPDPDVAGLQTALAVKGYYRGQIDGFPGPLTSAAVRALRRQLRLGASSLVDRRTLVGLGPPGRHRYGSRPLRLGTI